MRNNAFMKKSISVLMCGFMGGIIAGIIWLFLKLLNTGISFIWEWTNETIDLPFYTIAVCLLGGLIIGIFQKIFGPYPEELETVIAKVKKDKYYPYNNVFIICVAALLPLLFGGSIGPEAGLTGVIVGLCYWVGDRIKYADVFLKDITKIGLSSALGTIFGAPLFGLVMPIEEKVDYDKEITISKFSKIIYIIVSVMSAFGVFSLLNSLFGGGVGMPHIEQAEITVHEIIFGIPLALIGAVFGICYLLFDRFTKAFFTKIQKKIGIVISTMLGGLILGVIGTYFPMTMFSGEESMGEIITTYKEYAPWVLILTGILKLLITNVCIKSGWRGGHFFPVIFSGVSIGCAVAILTGLNDAFCIGVVTAGVLGVIMRKPFAVSLLLMLCFPLRVIPWLIISAFIGSIIPLKKLLPTEKETE
ncbi:MAG: chloride channel protein [Ruminococcus sp.]